MEKVIGSPMGVRLSKKVKFIFSDSLIQQPLIYEMSKVYDIITNIERASVNEFEGWVIMEISGTGDEIDSAFQWMTNQGVFVQTIFSDF